MAGPSIETQRLGLKPFVAYDAAEGAPIIKGYDDLFSPGKKITKRAFRGLYNQILGSGEVSFNFLGNPERLVSTLAKAASGDNEDSAAAATYVIFQIAIVGGRTKIVEEPRTTVQNHRLSEHYQQFDKFGVNETLASLATEAEGYTQQYAALAIIVQGFVSEKNDDLIIDTFRSATTDDDVLRWILFGLLESVHDIPGSSGRKRPISSELANALYELPRWRIEEKGIP